MGGCLNTAAVRPAAVFEMDRCVSTAAVTVVAAATATFRAGLADPRAVPLQHVAADAARWSPLFLGGRRRAQLAAPYAVAIEAAERCLGRLDAQVAQVRQQAGMPLALPATLATHVAAQRVACARALAALRSAAEAPRTPAGWVPTRRSATAAAANLATPPRSLSSGVGVRAPRD